MKKRKRSRSGVRALNPQPIPPGKRRAKRKKRQVKKKL